MLLLADILLVAHFAIAALIGAGFVLIPLGAWSGWRWVRWRRLRQAHLGAIAFVAAEAVLGIACPLTVWEDLLRAEGATDGGFVARWISRILYWDLPTWAFTCLYLSLASLALGLWRLIPPHARRPRRQRKGGNSSPASRLS